MPLYDFKCTTCQKAFEDFRPIADRFSAPCPYCNGGIGTFIMSSIRKSSIYPFVTEDFDGTPTEVKSRSHYRELCRKHGVYAKHEFGLGYNIGEI